MTLLRRIREAVVPEGRRETQKSWQRKRQSMKGGDARRSTQETKKVRPREELIQATDLASGLVDQARQIRNPHHQLQLARQTLKKIIELEETFGRIKLPNENKYFEQLERLRNELTELISTLKEPTDRPEQSADTETETDHPLVLPHLDLKFLEPILETISSGGNDCVPTTSFYLAILAMGETDPSEIAKLKHKTDQVARLEKDRKGIGPNGWLNLDSFTEKLFSHLNLHIPHSIFDITLGFPPGTSWDDSLSTKFNAVVKSWMKEGRFRSDTYADTASKKIEKGHKFEELPVFSVKTARGIEGEIIFLPRNNPYFQQHPEQIPPNNRWKTAGEHNILLLDYSNTEDEQYGYFLDPMSGVIFKYPLASVTNQMDLAPNDKDKLLPLKGVGANLALLR